MSLVAELEPGTMVSPNIRLERLLGKGGMGSVWAAEHLALETEVAVKFISPELARKDPTIIPRFRREAKSAARIRSPHVVEIKDYGVMDDDTPYMVMELLEGESLADRLARCGRLSLREAGLLVAQVAQVLGAAHAQGIIHRDIKPENIFLMASDYELFAKVLDFGVAKVRATAPSQRRETGLTETGAMVGTPEFMSPEQVQGEELDERSDLWSLGVVVYRALTGKLPFSGNSTGAVCIAISKGEYPAAGTVRGDIPEELDDWFDRVLRLDPNERHASAREMAEAFIDIVKSIPDVEPESEGPASSFDSLLRLLRRADTHDGLEAAETTPASGELAPPTAPHPTAESKPDDAQSVGSAALPSGGDRPERTGSRTFGGSTASLGEDAIPKRRAPVASVSIVVAVIAASVVLYVLSDSGSDGPAADEPAAQPAADGSAPIEEPRPSDTESSEASSELGTAGAAGRDAAAAALSSSTGTPAPAESVASSAHAPRSTPPRTPPPPSRAKPSDDGWMSER